MTGFEGWGDFDGGPWDRYVAHQAAKGNLFSTVLVDNDLPAPKICGMCRRGWHHECFGCGCPCNADESVLDDVDQDGEDREHDQHDDQVVFPDVGE